MPERPGRPPSDDTEGEALLRELGRIAREDRAEETVRRPRTGPGGQREAHEAGDPYDLVRPLGEAFRAEMARRLEVELAAPAGPPPGDEAGSGAATGGQGGSGAMPAGTGQGAAAGGGSAAARRRPTRQRPRRLLPWLAAAAAAAGLAGWWLLPSAVERHPLPAYTLGWSGGLAALRSAAGEAADLPRWGGDAELYVTLRPATAVRGPVHAHLYLLRPEEVRSWPGPAPEVARSGAVRVRGRLAAPPPAAGEWTILVLLGRSDAPPRHEEVLAIAQGEAPAAGWTLLRQRVEIVAVR
jgi:hypothetical protein